MHKRFFLQALLLGTSLCATLSFAQTKPLEWVIGYPAGGGSDIVGRVIAEELGKSLNRPIIILTTNRERVPISRPIMSLDPKMWAI